MSKLIDGFEVPRPTVSSLYYLLGNLSHSWESIAEKLGISRYQVERINRDCANCNMRMIEAFDEWLKADVDCNWSKVIEVLNTMDESLAEKVRHYIREAGRIEHSWQKQDIHCDCVKPLKSHNYNQWWLEETACQDDVFAHSSIEGFILSCLSKHASKWYEIGIALQIPKDRLDSIKNSPDSDEKKLSKMIEIAIKDLFTWGNLINALLEEGLATAAKEVEMEVKSKMEDYVAPYLQWRPYVPYTPYTKSDFTSQWRSYTPYTRSDFTSQLEENHTRQQGYYSRLREALKLGDKVSEDEIWLDFDKHINEKNPTLNERKVIIDILKKITSIEKKSSKDIMCCVKKLEGEMETASDATNKLLQQKEILERKKEALIINKDEVSREIQEISESSNTQPSQLSKLESQHESIQNELTEVCNSLAECMDKLKYANADYEEIRKKLNKCMKELEKCKAKMERYQFLISKELDKALPKQGALYAEWFQNILKWIGQGQDEDKKREIERHKDYINYLEENLSTIKEEIQEVMRHIQETQKILEV